MAPLVISSQMFDWLLATRYPHKSVATVISKHLDTHHYFEIMVVMTPILFHAFMKKQLNF